MKRRKPRFVPSLVFTTGLASVVPACGGDTTTGVVVPDGSADGASGKPQGGSTGTGGRGIGGVIVLAIGGFGNQMGTGGATGSGGLGAGGLIIVLAIAGFTGSGGRTGTGGRKGTGGNIIILAMQGFAGAGPASAKPNGSSK